MKIRRAAERVERHQIGNDEVGGVACTRYGALLVARSVAVSCCSSWDRGGRKKMKFAGRARAASRRDQCRSRSPSEARLP